MRGRGPGWEEGDLQAFLKLGSDNDNFYLYRAPAKSTSWEPEFVIDLETLRRLRADVENRWLSGQAPSGAADCGLADVGAYVACDGPYLVHVRDPGINPPNLAAVQEISAGIFRVGETVTVPTVELWVDDIRLSEPVSQTGTAASVDARLVASDVAGLSVAYVQRNGQFRQINEDPSYRGSNVLQMAGNVRLDRFLPDGLGLAVPLTVNYSRTGVNPELLTGTDIRGDAISGFRKPDSRSATVNLAVRRRLPGHSWLVKGLVDPLSLSASLTRGRARTELGEARANSYGFNVAYQITGRRKGIRLPLGGIAKGLPGFIRGGELGKSLARADVSLVPTRVRLQSGLSRDESNSTAFRFPVARSDDNPFTTLSLNHLWRNSRGINLAATGDAQPQRGSRQHARPADLPGFVDARPAGVQRAPLPARPAGRSRAGPGAHHRAGAHAQPGLLVPAPVHHQQQFRAEPDPVEPGPGPGRRRQRCLHPPADPEQRADQRVWRIAGSRAGPAHPGGRQQRSWPGAPARAAGGREHPAHAHLDVRSAGVRPEPQVSARARRTRELSGAGRGRRPRGVGDARRDARERRRSAVRDHLHAVPVADADDAAQRVGEALVQTETKQHEFPVGNLRWSHTFRGGPLALVAVGTTFRRRQGSSLQVNRTGPEAETSTHSRTITPDVQLGLRNGVSVTLGFNTLDQDSRSNGNETQLDQNDITGGLNYRFRLPRSLSHSRKQVRSSLSYLQTASRTCLLQGAAVECSSSPTCGGARCAAGSTPTCCRR